MAEAAAGARPPARPPALLRATGVLAVLLGIIGVIGVIGILATARPAAASAFLVAATPSHGSALTTAPQEVLLTFSERVEVVGDGVAVVGPAGGRVDPGTVRRPRPEVVAVPLPGVVAVTRQGTYTVAWHVVSADSRPVRGAVTFSIGAAPGAARASATGAGPAVAGGYGLAAFAALAGLTMLAGGVALGRGAAPAANPGPRRLVMAGWTILVLATLALLALRGPYVAGAGLARAADRDLLGQTLHSHYGRALAVRLVLLGAVPVLLARGIGPISGPRPPRRPRLAAAGLAVVAVGLALTWAAVGDAATALALAAGVGQLLAVVTLPGVLVAVLVVRRAAPQAEPEPESPDRPEPPAGAGTAGGVAISAKTSTAPVTDMGAEAIGRRVGRLTAVCLAMIVVAGGYLERRALGGAADLLTTTYGRLLAIKIVALGGVLAVAVRLSGRLRASDGSGSAGARRLAAAGTALAAVVLALTTVLAEVRPAAQERANRPVTGSARFNVGAGAGTMEVRLPRTLRGVNAAGLTVVAGGRPQDIPGFRGAWTQPDIGVGPLPVRFTPVGAGRYRLDWPPLPVAGRWRLRITSGSAGSAGAVELTWRIT
jgi:copper transport protein